MEYGCITYFLPKYHCELNPIERIWAQAKQCSKAYCKYSIISLHKTVVPALESVSLENMKKHFMEVVRHYMLAYLEGLKGVVELGLAKQYKKLLNLIRKYPKTNEF